MFKTKNDLSEPIRVKVVELLNARLADCTDLQTQTKQAHWNVKGPNFIALHELFDLAREREYCALRSHRPRRVGPKQVTVRRGKQEVGSRLWAASANPRWY